MTARLIQICSFSIAYRLIFDLGSLIELCGDAVLERDCRHCVLMRRINLVPIAHTTTCRFRGFVTGAISEGAMRRKVLVGETMVMRSQDGQR
jgi:hypothetical protein